MDIDRVLAASIISEVSTRIDSLEVANYSKELPEIIKDLIEAVNILRNLRWNSEEDRIRDLRSIEICSVELELWVQDIKGFSSRKDVQAEIQNLKRSFEQVLETLERHI